MKPGFASIYRYTIPFVKPVPVRNSSLDTRDGLLLRLRTHDSRHSGFGEIAPLPGLHEETLVEALEQCSKIIRTSDLTFGDQSITETGRNLPDMLYPSVRTGIEMSLLNLQSAVTGIRPAIADTVETAARLPLNALLFGSTSSVLSMAEQYYNQGYRTFKLKVKAAEPALASDQAVALRTSFGSDISIRLDSNRSFGLDDACSFFSTIPGDSIDYIEEPVADPFLLPVFFERTGIRSALDESLWMNPGIWNRIPHDCLGGIVLKPSRLGSLSASIRFAIEAEQEGIPAVFSSAYESGVSIGFYAHLAAIITGRPKACGLDTFRQFSRDILIDPVHAENGGFPVEETYRNSLTPDLSRLELLETWTL